jgi:hypothetical protein
VSAAQVATENEIEDLYRNGLLASPLNGYCGRISPLECGLVQPQTLGNLDTEEMDWGSEFCLILIGSLTGEVPTSTGMAGSCFHH